MNTKARISSLRYRCSQCNELHHGLPEIAAALPDAIARLSEVDQRQRCQIASDFCILDGEHYFVRCVLELPIRHEAQTYGIGCWSTLSQASYKAYSDDFNGARSGGIGPFFGWFASTVPTFENPFQQKGHVHIRSGRLRPLIELESTDHPLAVAQRDGIELEQCLAIAKEIPGIKFVVK